jgi:hypothetical protein
MTNMIELGLDGNLFGDEAAAELQTVIGSVRALLQAFA